MKTTLSTQCGAPYIPMPKGRGFTANPDKKRNTVVIKILPAVEREDVVESKVVYYDYDLRIRAFKKLYEQVMDASCLPCED